MADAAGDDGEGQGAALQILRFGQHTGGDIAAFDNDVLHALHDEVDAGAAEAAAGGGVIGRVGGGERPVKNSEVALEDDVLDGKARGFFCRQAAGVGSGRRLQAHVGCGFLLLAQGAVALDLALQFLGNGSAGYGLGLYCRRECRAQQGDGEQRNHCIAPPRR